MTPARPPAGFVAVIRWWQQFQVSHEDTQRPEEEGSDFSLFSEFCFFDKEETFAKKLSSRPPLPEH